MARPPKSVDLKVFEGNPGKRPLNHAEPKPTKGAPTCPVWLDAEAKAEWKRVVPELKRIGVLTKLDRAVLVAYCQAWADFVWATKFLVEESSRIITGGKDGYKMQNPAVSIKRQATKELQQFGTLLGLNPSARTRLHVVPQHNKPKSKFEGLLS